MVPKLIRYVTLVTVKNIFTSVVHTLPQRKNYCREDFENSRVCCGKQVGQIIIVIHHVI